MSERRFTARQAAAWPEAIGRLNAAGANVTETGYWSIDFADEVRPGRGHSVNAQWNDGETYAQVLMDVYGYPNVSFARLDWVHADSNEECDCEPCEAEREAEE